VVGGGEGATPVAEGGGLVRARSVDLFVERRGRGASVVFLHGLADDHRLWRKVVPQLADRYEVVVVDSPGHGRSGPIPEGVPLEWFADEVRGLIEALRLDQPVVVGLSMGGGIAQYLASRYPGLLRGLVLVSTSPVHPEATRERFLTRADRAEREGMASILDITVPRWFTPPFMDAHPEDVAATEATVLSIDPVQFARASRANAERDCTPGLAAIDCPVLFIGGLQDPADPQRSVPIYERELRDVEIALNPDTSHLIPIEAPDWFAATLRRFLDRLDHEAEA
jgi:pimeloyl-ACP methyl ester carboxylesterase